MIEKYIICIIRTSLFYTMQYFTIFLNITNVITKYFTVLLNISQHCTIFQNITNVITKYFSILFNITQFCTIFVNSAKHHKIFLKVTLPCSVLLISSEGLSMQFYIQQSNLWIGQNVTITHKPYSKHKEHLLITLKHSQNAVTLYSAIKPLNRPKCNYCS